MNVLWLRHASTQSTQSTRMRTYVAHTCLVLYVFRSCPPQPLKKAITQMQMLQFVTMNMQVTQRPIHPPLVSVKPPRQRCPATAVHAESGV